jgi:hypothetical protein
MDFGARTSNLVLISLTKLGTPSMVNLKKFPETSMWENGSVHRC